jgi:hypothetical protein
VFALGVMLYELLTGELPWADGAAATDTDPLRPSARVTTSTQPAAPSTVAQRRQLAATLRGDLDWITLKALARERDDRYQAVAELAADIERHLRGETVSVGPPSLRYRLRKFVRRKRAVIAVSLSGVVVVAGLGIAFAYGSTKQAEAEDARTAVATNQADVRSVVARLLQRAEDPALFGTAAGDDVRKALGIEAVHFADALLASDPDDVQLQAGRCDALQSLSRVCWLLGEPTQARAVANEAVHIGERLFAAEPSSLRWRALLGTAQMHLGRAIMLAGDAGQAHSHLASAAEHLAACRAAQPDRYATMYAGVLLDVAGTLPPAANEQAISACRQAIDLYQSRPEIRDPATTLHGDYVGARLWLVRLLAGSRRHQEAKDELDSFAGEILRLDARRGDLASEFYRLRGQVRRQLGERGPSTLPDLEAAVAAAEQYRIAQPRRHRAHRGLGQRLIDLGYVQNYIGEFATSSASYHRSIEAAETMVRLFPDDPTALSFLCTNLCTFAYVLRDRFRRSDLAEAAACVTRAIEVETQIPASVVTGRTPRWQLATTLAGIEESRGAVDWGRLWREVDAMLPPGDLSWHDADLDIWLEAGIGIARWRLANGELDQAAERLQAAHTAAVAGKADKRLVEIEYLQASIAATNGDHAAAAAAADRVLACRNTWYGRRRAADCMYLAWRAARSQPATDPEIVAGYRQLAVQWYGMVVRTLDEDITQDPRDPWYVLPWAFSKLHLADMEAADGNTGEAKELLATALQHLEAVHEEAQLDQWDETSYRAGVELQQRLEH